MEQRDRERLPHLFVVVLFVDARRMLSADNIHPAGTGARKIKNRAFRDPDRLIGQPRL